MVLKIKVKLNNDTAQIICSYEYGKKYTIRDKKISTLFYSLSNVEKYTSNTNRVKFSIDQIKCDCDLIKYGSKIEIVIEIGEKINKNIFFDLINCVFNDYSIEIIFSRNSSVILDLKKYTNIHTIRLKNGYDTRLKYLPENLLNLYLSKHHNPNAQINSNITNLYLDNRYNKKINLIDMQSENIDFGYQYTQPIDNLNDNVKKITIRSNYLLPLDNLPPSVKELNLTNEFNSSLDYLSNTLEILKINDTDYTHSLDNLPFGIKYFEFNVKRYDEPNSIIINLNNLPNSIETLKVQYFNFLLGIKKLPTKIKEIIIIGISKKYYVPLNIQKLLSNVLNIDDFFNIENHIKKHFNTMCEKQNLNDVVLSIE